MKFDTIIIGGGLSGLTCGITLAERGVNCAIISAGQSALHFCSGSFDLLGSVNGFEVETPASTMFKVLNENHPYSLIGYNNIIDLAGRVPSFFSDMGIKVNGSAAKNHYRITPMGTMKPTWLSLDDFTPIAEKNNLPWHKISIQNIAGFLDFHTKFVADSFERMGAECKISAFSTPELAQVRKSPSEMRSASIAKVFENETNLRKAAEIIEQNAADADVIMLPAVFGIQNSRPVELLRSIISKTICLVPVVPPSVPGIRTQIMMRKRFQKLGGTYLLGDTVTGGDFKDGRLASITTVNHSDIKFHASEFILASGSFFSHGIAARPDGIYEPIFHLDVVGSNDRSEWFNKNLFDEQPYMTYGVATDNDFRATVSGKPIDNLHVIGSVLSSFNPLKEASGAGVSILTALHVANKIAK